MSMVAASSVYQDGHVSVGNCTAAPLGAGETFTGNDDDMKLLVVED